MPWNNASPFPPAGKRFAWTTRECYAVRVKYNDLWTIWGFRRFAMIRRRWPFFCWNVFGSHGYIGWRPVDLRDPGFRIPAGFPRDVEAGQFGFRMGVGKIS